MKRKVMKRILAAVLIASLVMPSAVSAATAGTESSAGNLQKQQLDNAGEAQSKDSVMKEGNENQAEAVTTPEVPSSEEITSEATDQDTGLNAGGDSSLEDSSAEDPVNPDAQAKAGAIAEAEETDEPVSELGAVKKQGWVLEDGHWLYYQKNGTPITNNWLVQNNTYYYFDAKGWMVTGWKQIKGANFYFNPKNGADIGKMLTGWQTINGKKYYLKKTGDKGQRGKALTGWQTLSKKVYYFNKSGVMCKGWTEINKKFFYFDSKGVRQTGWKLINNNWFYLKKKGSYGTAGKALTGWVKLGGQVYYLKKSGGKGTKGKMLTGWQTIGAYNYYFASSGALKTGWVKLSGKWFYFKKVGSYGTQGKMLTGWRTIKGTTYYLKKTGNKGTKGKMLTGWVTLSNKTFYFDASGGMKIGWITLSGKRYYLKTTGSLGDKGARYANGKYTIEGRSYTFDKNGVCTNFNDTVDYIYLTDPADGKTRKVEPQIQTDPQIGKDITEEEFLAAVLYTESGDQGYEGQIMVGLTILNRVASSEFPNSLKFVIYSDGQFEVARNGTLTRCLERIRDKEPEVSYLTTYKSMQAAKKAKSIFNAYKKNGTARSISGITLPNNKKDFDYLFFMTHSSFIKLKLDDKKCDTYIYRYKYSASQQNRYHIFFKKWVKSS